MISLDQMKSLINQTCFELGDKFCSDSATQLILETGLVECKNVQLQV